MARKGRRVYLSVDMEGVAGIVHVDQTRPNGQDFSIGRELMTGEANAAALGAFDGGATEVVVNDSHGDMRNLIFPGLDPRVQVLLGDQKPLSMMEGIDGGPFDVAMFVGYHASMGTANATLDHTYYGAVVTEIAINGKRANEAYINALVAGAHGTPVGLVAGDQACCEEARQLIPGVETVPVKWAIGRQAARSLHPQEARNRIREAAERVTRNAPRFRPVKIPPPLRLTIRMIQTSMADAAAQMPGTKRVDGWTVSYEARDVMEMFRAMLCLVRLGSLGRLEVRPR